MLAARDQENLVHAHQTTAAGKPLNQGLRQLQPKTPGTRAPKTPFKVPLNDENDLLAFGKKTAKATGGRNENTLKPAKDAFITPMGPRNRAPLGMKTTNAKAKGFQTPAPPGDALKPEKTNRKSSTAQKVKKAAPIVQQAQPEARSQLDEDDVPDVEYAPPTPIELPDDPEEITYDTSFPQFQGRNMAMGWERIYHRGEVGEDGLTDRERKFQQDSIAYDKHVDEMIQKQVDNMELKGINVREDPEIPCWEEMEQQRRQEKLARDNAKKPQLRSVSTVKSRDAAAALSQSSSSSNSRVTTTKSATAPRPKKTSILTVPKRKAAAPANPSTMRHTAAAASSRTTVGYSKGRNVSSTLPGKASQPKDSQTESKSIVSPEKYMQLYGPPPAGSDMWSKCHDAGLVDDDEIAQAEAAILTSLYEEDGETRNFQLTL